MASHYDTIRIERPVETVASVVLDRPAAYNRINPGMLDDLEAAVEELSVADDVRVVYLTGSAETFSQGADLTAFEFDQDDHRTGVETSRWGHRVFRQLRDLDLPVVAGLNGDCFGGGMELTMCADLRVASSDANIGLPEQSVGLIPGWGGTTWLQELIGQSAAKYVLFTARPLPAERLLELGFVHEVYPDAEFDERAMAFVERIASNAPLAQRYAKRTMHEVDNFDTGPDTEAHAWGHLVDSADFAEGVSALGKERDPEFRGE